MFGKRSSASARWGIRLAGTFVVAMAAMSAWPQELPSEPGATNPASFWARATLYRDEWGTPHIYADDWPALGFAFGYAQAEDHLEPMLIAYRVANGRAAEVLGEYYSDSDQFSLKMAHAELARKVFADLDPLTQDLCSGFAMGVNAWIVDHPDRTPPWADGIKPEDPLALLHCYLMSMAPFDLPDAYFRAPSSTTGNAWAVAPSMAQSGKTILAINPHTAYGSPFQWYEAHLVCEDMNVAGATLFGLPVIMQGHNESAGWALTPNRPDFGDIYIEPGVAARSNPKSVNGPVLPSEQSLFQMMILSHSQTYYVNTPEGPVERSVPCVETAHGPVVEYRGGRMYSYRVGGYHDFGTIFQLVQMARAPNLDAFREAMALHQLPCFHVVYGDQAGNIFYLYNVKVGNKASAALPPPPKDEKEEATEPPPPPKLVDWRLPLSVGDPLHEWGEVIPVGALPQVVNPECGYVQASGGPPWTSTQAFPMKPEEFPIWFGADCDTFRAQRVRSLLSMGKRTFRDCQSMLYDCVVPFAVEAVPRLLALAEERPDFVKDAHPDLASGLELLKNWNRLSDVNSVGMTFFHAWWTALRAKDPAAFGSDENLYVALAQNSPEIRDLVINAAADAARFMRNEFDSISVPWGRVHTIRRAEREMELAGAVTGEPIFTNSDFVYEDRKWRTTYGYGFAMVVEFGDKPSAVSMTPFGASENPDSPHFSDQLDLLSERRFKITRFQIQDVQRNASSARGCMLELRPRGMDGLFTFRAPFPMSARLNVSIEPPAETTEGLVPFTLFVEAERAPRHGEVEVQVQLSVPAVLCAKENFGELAIYGYDPLRAWMRIEDQQLAPEARTLTVTDIGPPRTYVVLGPEEYRASRLTIPGETELPVQATAEAPAAGESKEETGASITRAEPLPPASTPEQGRSSEDPAKPPILVPRESDGRKQDDEPPKIRFNLPTEESSKKGKNSVRRNYNLHMKPESQGNAKK